MDWGSNPGVSRFKVLSVPNVTSFPLSASLTADILSFVLIGTCINNTSVMMFKKGSFEIDATVYPVAIKVRIVAA